MPHPPSPYLLASLDAAPPSEAAAFASILGTTPWGTATWAAVALGLAGVCTALRTSLHRAVPAHFLENEGDGPVAQLEPHARGRIARLLERRDSLAASVSLVKIAFEVAFVALVVALVAGDDAPTAPHLAVALAIAAPLILLIGESLPTSIARAREVWILSRLLPAASWMLRPVEGVVWLLDGARRALLRGLGLRDTPRESRELVEGFRAIVESEELGGKLEDHTRELLSNVMDFRDVDAAEVMTPRTELAAVSITADMSEAVAVFADSGYSRIPVYDGTIDTVIGTLSAIEAAKAIAEERLDATPLRQVLRPPLLVPETKRITELLTEFRAQKQKMAIVVDEYGGTAGLVTLADVITELVGELPDEYEDDAPPIRVLPDGAAEVEAGTHVSEVNEALGLELPEEADFETLGGFVLAELGRFPTSGEVFLSSGVEFAVLEASDRRVIRVRVRRTA